MCSSLKSIVIVYPSLVWAAGVAVTRPGERAVVARLRHGRLMAGWYGGMYVVGCKSANILLTVLYCNMYSSSNNLLFLFSGLVRERVYQLYAAVLAIPFSCACKWSTGNRRV